MVVPLGVRIKETRSRLIGRDGRIRTREFNKLMKVALEHGARFWIREFLPLHFKPGASQRYGYQARSARYRAIKRRAQQIRIQETGDVVPAPKPPAPLVWAGSWRDQIAATPPEAFNVATSGVTGKEKARVFVPIPHPMRPGYAREIATMTADEARIWSDVVFGKLLEQLGETTTVTTRIASAA